MNKKFTEFNQKKCIQWIFIAYMIQIISNFVGNLSSSLSFVATIGTYASEVLIIYLLWRLNKLTNHKGYKIACYVLILAPLASIVVNIISSALGINAFAELISALFVDSESMTTEEAQTLLAALEKYRTAIVVSSVGELIVEMVVLLVGNINLGNAYKDTIQLEENDQKLVIKLKKVLYKEAIYGTILYVAGAILIPTAYDAAISFLKIILNGGSVNLASLGGIFIIGGLICLIAGICMIVCIIKKYVLTYKVYKACPEEFIQDQNDNNKDDYDNVIDSDSFN